MFPFALLIMRLLKTITILALFAFVATSCKRKGCTNPKATNFSSDAKKDDGSCVYDFTDPDFDFTLDDESTYSINFDGDYYSESDNEGDTELHSSSYKNYANGYSNAVVYSSFIKHHFFS